MLIGNLLTNVSAEVFASVFRVVEVELPIGMELYHRRLIMTRKAASTPKSQSAPFISLNGVTFLPKMSMSDLNVVSRMP